MTENETFHKEMIELMLMGAYVVMEQSSVYCRYYDTYTLF